MFKCKQEDWMDYLLDMLVQGQAESIQRLLGNLQQDWSISSIPTSTHRKLRGLEAKGCHPSSTVDLITDLPFVAIMDNIRPLLASGPPSQEATCSKFGTLFNSSSKSATTGHLSTQARHSHCNSGLQFPTLPTPGTCSASASGIPSWPSGG